MREPQLQDVQNAIVGSTVTTEGGDVLVNGHKITNYFYSTQYQDLKKQADELEARFVKTQQKIVKYPDDEDFKGELLRISEQRNEARKRLIDFKQEVIRLAETFTKLPINTRRLKLAQQHFEAGDYAAARAVLDAEQMGSELDALLRRDEQMQQQQAEVQALRMDKANEYLILARLTDIDFTIPNRFEQTSEHFEQSLKAAHTPENTFEYAYFLLEHNQFNTALPLFKEALASYRRLAEANPQTYLPRVAMTATNLSLFYLQSLSDRERSLDYAREALAAALPFVKRLPAAENYARTTLQVVERWEIDTKTFLEETIQSQQSTAE
jgi:tetratricopeptide (TPR) repeat protein